MSEVTNLMAKLKSMICADQKVSWIDVAMDCLERAKQSDQYEEESLEKIVLLCKQLRLDGVKDGQKLKFGRKPKPKSNLCS